jgi:hypothetical protein
MKKALVIFFLLSGCAHAIKNVSDCDRVDGVKRVECGACTLQNKAGGYLGEYEYKPDNDAGKRCVQLK